MKYSKALTTRLWVGLFMLVVMMVLVIPMATSAQSEEPVVIYLFWGDGCPHCEQAKPAMRELAQRYPNVEVREYEVWYQPENQAIFADMAAAFGFEPHYVPTIFVGEHYWEGYAADLKTEIESVVAGCVESGCPDPGVNIVSVPTQTTAPQEILASFVPLTQMRSDGFTLAVIVMSGMGVALIYAGLFLRRGRQRGKARRPIPDPLGSWRMVGMLTLCLVGLGVAGYLAYVETQRLPAVCGPVGDCNTVQSSSYARLFGVLPIGVLGVAGYLAILAAWAWGQLRRDRLSEVAQLAVLGMALFGVLFSVYLTYLELFVIRAVCMWCVTSAVIMTLIMLLALFPARQAWKGVPRAQKKSAL